MKKEIFQYIRHPTKRHKIGLLLGSRSNCVSHFNIGWSLVHHSDKFSKGIAFEYARKNINTPPAKSIKNQYDEFVKRCNRYFKNSEWANQYPEKEKMMLPCPFCGEIPKIIKQQLLGNNTAVYNIGCSNIECNFMPTSTFTSADNAIKCWNTRYSSIVINKNLNEINRECPPIVLCKNRENSEKPILDLENSNT